MENIKVQIKLLRGNESIAAFLSQKDPKFFPISICQINVDNPDFSFNCRPSTFCFTTSDTYGSRIREQKGED